MFFNQCRPFEEGNLVILYERYDKLHPVWLKRGGTFQNRFGVFKHDSIIGSIPGSKITAANNGGWMYVLYPTAEHWTLALRHRTQILYNTDISLVCLHLNLKPGSIVIESGTGSGSLTHSLARCVAPSGKVITHDFHQERADKAREEFERNGLGSVVESVCRDVCCDGFVCNDKADAVFLDLPSPWLAVPHAANVLKAGAKICSFSPCIEQVQRACESLREAKFKEIRTIECLVRPIDVVNFYQQTPDFTLYQGLGTRGNKRKANEECEEEDGQAGGKDVPNTTQACAKKSRNNDNVGYLCIKPQADIRGHTGFLTFAVKS